MCHPIRKHPFPLRSLAPLGIVTLLCLAPGAARATPAGGYVRSAPVEGGFELATQDAAAPLWVSAEDFAGVARAAQWLRDDIERVTGARPEVSRAERPTAESVVIIGTLGRSPVIDRLVESGALDVSRVEGKWEASVTQVVANPAPGVEQALVIAGSDKRGAIYGALDLSAAMGVSPWCWWADVAPQRRGALYVAPGAHVRNEPAVKYRGFFINDEAPALANWAQEKFGGCNHRFYDKVFELLLRMRGNYLWPAMWGRSLWDDDPQSARLADEYGVVLGTSHHEPMMRAHVEWARYGEGPWDYSRNEERLRRFWYEGASRAKDREVLVTVGMRGDGDEPMSEEANIELLQRIVSDQRTILGEVLGKPPEQQPQVWALYKEVQEYYDKGMRAPDDVTLLLCDDNWGNLRRLPPPGAPPRKGGYGVYYHYDYVGDPRNYKWINTNPLPRVWEQMHLAYRNGVDRLWIVNVGDIKPMEFPTEFFLDYAWAPEEWPADRLGEYTRLWAARQFGARHADEIAGLLSEYAKYNSRRKPELLSPETYSLIAYHEAERVVDQYARLAREAKRIRNQLPERLHSAYYQLVLHPILACANLNELYVTIAKNRLYAEQGRRAATALARRARRLFQRDEELTARYHALEDGKWNHMMSQTHIGYTYWQQPEEQSMPEVQEIDVSGEPELAVAIEGARQWWPESHDAAVLPEMVAGGADERYIDVFNRGRGSVTYRVEPGEPWLHASPAEGTIEEEQRVTLSVDWRRAPVGARRVAVRVLGGDGVVATVEAPVTKPAQPQRLAGLVLEQDGAATVAADAYSRRVDGADAGWRLLPDHGRTGSAMTPMPVTVSAQSPGGGGPRLEYDLYLTHPGQVTVACYLSPTQNLHDTGGLRYAVSFDDQPPKVVNMHADRSHRAWQQAVANNINVSRSTHDVTGEGRHTLKLWMVDPAVVVQKIVVETTGARESYLGPPPVVAAPLEHH